MSRLLDRIRSSAIFERAALILSVAILGGWLIFWAIQVMGVYELLSLAYDW